MKMVMMMMMLQERDIRSLESTIKHELLHAFGFSSSLFAFFRDTDGDPRTERLEDGMPAINLDLWKERVTCKGGRRVEIQ